MDQLDQTEEWMRITGTDTTAPWTGFDMAVFFSVIAVVIALAITVGVLGGMLIVNSYPWIG